MGALSLWHWLIIAGVAMLFIWVMMNQGAAGTEDISKGMEALTARKNAEAEAAALAEARRLEEERLAELARLEAERKAAQEGDRVKLLILAKQKSALEEEITGFKKQLAFFRKQDPDEVSDSEYARANGLHREMGAKQKQLEEVAAELKAMRTAMGV